MPGRLQLDPRNLEETALYVHSLFPGEERCRVKRKTVSFGDKSYDLECWASESFALEALRQRQPGASFAGVLAFDLKPSYRRGAHSRRAKLSFGFEQNALDNLNLQYGYGNLDLYLDWYLEWEEQPALDFATFVEEGEALNRKYEADPKVERDVSNIHNLHLFPVFVRSPFFKIFEELYNEIMQRLLKPVEHHELHTDVGGYDEAVRRDREALSFLEEKPLSSVMEENIPSSAPSEEKIPLWKTIDPEHPKNEAERRAFQIVDETARDPEYHKVSKR